MKTCNICNNHILTREYYESENFHMCLDCGKRELVNVHGIYVHKLSKDFLGEEGYNVDEFNKVSLDGEEIDDLINHLTSDLRSKNDYIKGLHLAIERKE